MYRQFYRAIALFSLVIMVSLLISPNMTRAQAQIDGDNAIAQPFVSHYWRYRGERALGFVQSTLMDANGYPVQYFEKGRLEDHSNEIADPSRRIMYGRLTAEMMEIAPSFPVNGTLLTYGDLYRYSYTKFAVPPGFTGGTMALENGVFVPSDHSLQPAPGFIVPYYFWNFINRTDLFPRGWLYDVGLPLTDVFETQILVNGEYQNVSMQAFERTILSYNPNNAAGWQVQRVNIGTDALVFQGYDPLYIEPTRPTGPKRIEINLSAQYLYAFEGDYMVYEIPVSTGRPGWETPAGSFSVFSKLLSHDMQGNVAGESWYVPDVPHAMYFAAGGYAIHGTYWHNTFGTGARLSHGCVNLPLDMAAALYNWTPLGTPVSIYY
jgi:lipoprotein-anchoring transpeptidase ErfK/SrfK